MPTCVEILAGQVQLHVPEAVDEEDGYVDDAVVERGSGSSSRTSASGASGGPSSAGSTPSARCAAAGANRSRAWNVRDTVSSAYAGFAISCALSIPAASAAGTSSPLSGPTNNRRPGRAR